VRCAHEADRGRRALKLLSKNAKEKWGHKEGYMIQEHVLEGRRALQLLRINAKEKWRW
jgi:hypothetical protein